MTNIDRKIQFVIITSLHIVYNICYIIIMYSTGNVNALSGDTVKSTFAFRLFMLFYCKNVNFPLMWRSKDYFGEEVIEFYVCF